MSKFVLRRFISILLWPLGVIAYELKRPFLPPLGSLVALATGAILMWLTGQLYVFGYEYGLVSYNFAGLPLSGRIGLAIFWYILGIGVQYFEKAFHLDLDPLELQYAHLTLLGAMLGSLIPLS